MADRYLVATGNWNTTASWSATDAGAAGASFPVAGDRVFLTANSSAFTLTINVASACLEFNCTGTTAIVLHSASVTLTVGGNLFKLVAGMGYTASATTSLVTFSATTGTTLLTSGGKSFGGLTVNGVGGVVQLQDALKVDAFATSALTLTNGSFVDNGFSVTASSFSSNNSNTRVITSTATSWTLGGAAVSGTVNPAWVTTTTTGLTYNKNSTNLNIVGSGANSFAGGGLTFNTLSVNVNGELRLFGSNTFAAVTTTLSAPLTISLAVGVTQTITAAPTWTGSSSNRVLIVSNSVGFPATISVPSGTMALTYTAIKDLTFSGGATFTATNSDDLGGNTGIMITGPSGGGGGGRAIQVNNPSLVA